MNNTLQEHSTALTAMLNVLKYEREFAARVIKRCDEMEYDYNFYLTQYQSAVGSKIDAFDRDTYLKVRHHWTGGGYCLGDRVNK